jgi:hypothetical protein
MSSARLGRTLTRRASEDFSPPSLARRVSVAESATGIKHTIAPAAAVGYNRRQFST